MFSQLNCGVPAMGGQHIVVDPRSCAVNTLLSAKLTGGERLAINSTNCAMWREPWSAARGSGVTAAVRLVSELGLS